MAMFKYKEIQSLNIVVEQLPSSHMDIYEGFGSIVVFNPAIGLITVPAKNYHFQLYSFV
ncbi:hypothetical protein OROMI_006782 [Orobanche minor]